MLCVLRGPIALRSLSLAPERISRCAQVVEFDCPSIIPIDTSVGITFEDLGCRWVALTASSGEIRPSGTTDVASMQIAPTPRVAKP